MTRAVGMNVLSIDTASPDASVALAVGGQIFEEALPAERRASEELLPALRRVVEAAAAADAARPAPRRVKSEGPAQGDLLSLGSE